MPLGLSKNLFQRIVSAVLLLPFVLGPLWAGGWWFTGFLILGGVLMAREWVQLTCGKSIGLEVLLALLAVVLLLLVQRQDVDLLVASSILGGAVGVGFILGQVTVTKKLGWTFVGLAYVGAPLIAMWWLRAYDSGLMVLWVFFIVWATDIGGYFFGKGIGGPKLAPKISPKKTWAGLLGGMALSVAVGLFLHFGFDLPGGMGTVALISAMLAVWAQVGDLVESGIKRHFNVKDSGELIPGHGGLLDRVDGLVFVAPAMALLLAWLPQLFVAS